MKNRQFINKADPFYCGTQDSAWTDTLLHSAGVNFYLALMAFRFYSAEEFLTFNSLEQVTRVKKTHSDCLYWNDHETRHYNTWQGDISDEVKNYFTKIAPWFMKKAYEIFDLESALVNECSANVQQDIHAFLAEDYLRIAFMEDYCSFTCYYYLDKALEHCRQSSPSYQKQYRENLEQYIAAKEKIFDIQFNKWRQNFNVEKENRYRSRTLSEWELCYNVASQQKYIVHEDYAEEAYYTPRQSNDTDTLSVDSGDFENRASVSIYRQENPYVVYHQPSENSCITPQNKTATIMHEKLKRS